MTQSGHGPLRIAAVDVRKLFVASGLQNSEKIQRAAIGKSDGRRSVNLKQAAGNPGRMRQQWIKKRTMKPLHIIICIGVSVLIIAPMPAECQPQAEPVQAVQAVQAEPVQAEPVQAEPVQAEPVQAAPVQAVQAEPVQAATEFKPPN